MEHSANGATHGNGDAVSSTNGALNYALELPPRTTDDQVPLSVVIERVVGLAHAELANLAETLPSSKDADRKRAIVEYVLQTRRQILKLLVLVRWSKEADNLARCNDIINFLALQTQKHEPTIAKLAEVKLSLASARVRNYDLPTAITVLTTGTYPDLPSILQEQFVQPALLPDALVLKTLAQMDEVLRYRLAMVEKLHRKMKGYRIADGRATFRSEGMWEASFAYGGDNDEEAEWYLLSVTFLFRVSEASGVWSNTPTGPIKDHIVSLCNQELARRPPTPPETEGADAVVEDKPVSEAPLIRGYNFLQRLSLNYQIEAVYTQTLRLIATSWAGNLRAELSTDRKTLRIEYWIEIRPPPPAAAAPATAPRPPAPPPPGVITISTISTPAPTDPSQRAGTVDSIRKRALERALLSDLDMDNSQADDVPDQLSITWSAEELSPEKRANLSMEMDQDLDVEALLSRVTRAHAKESTLQIFELLQKDGHSLGPDAISLDHELDDLAIRICLHGRHVVQASIDNFSGRLELKALGEASTTRESRMRSVADKVNENRQLIVDSLLRIRASTIMDEVESRAVYLGYTTLRRLPIRQSDLFKFGAVTRYCLFLQLPFTTPPATHYLVLILADEGFRFALVSLKAESDPLQSYMTIEEIDWMSRTSPPGEWTIGPTPSEFGFELSLPDLRNVYEHALRRISFFKIEQQFHLRRIPYRTILPPATDSGSAPYLIVKSDQLLRGTARITHPNVAIQCLLKENKIRVTFHIRFHDVLLAPSQRPNFPPNMRYDSRTSIITFSSDDVEDCISIFLAAYSSIASSVVLAQHHRSAKKISDKSAAKLKLAT